jgi:hypothetical protein
MQPTNAGTEGASAVTRYELYAVLLAVTQLLVSGLGFIVVAWSLRVLIKTLDAQSSAAVAARQLEFDKTVLSYPDLYPYFYEGRELARDDPEYARTMAATQLLANYFDGYLRQQGRFRQMWPDEQWKAYIQDYVRKSSVLRGYVTANPAWFSPEFVKMCQAVGGQK